MAEVPVWLLDIDGVINANADKPDPTVWTDWIAGEAANEAGLVYPMLTAKPVVDFISRLHKDGVVEVRWHTTWQTAAQRVADTVGLPRFPVQHAPEYEEQQMRDVDFFGGPWWKLPAAERVVREEGRRLVWTDDDAAWMLDAEERQRLDGALIIAPETHLGLTLRELRQIADFCDVEPPS